MKTILLVGTDYDDFEYDLALFEVPDSVTVEMIEKAFSSLKSTTTVTLQSEAKEIVQSNGWRMTDVIKVYA